jgi:hypothetical protein
MLPSMAPPTARIRSAATTVAALGAILVVGALLRGLGLRWGDPYVYHPDEWMIAGHAMTMVATTDWNPHTFVYPSLLLELHAGLVALLHGFRPTTLAVGQPGLYEGEFLPQQFRYIAAGRILVSLMGIATIPVVFEAARRLTGVAGGLAAAAILAVLPLAVEHAHYLTTDVPVAFLCAVCLLATVVAAQSGRMRWWVLAGLVAGLAGSTKWNGLLVVGVPLLALLATRLAERPSLATVLERDVVVRVVAILAAAAVGVVGATPGIVLAPAEVGAWLSLLTDFYRYPDPRQTEGSLGFHLRSLVAGFGPVLAFCVVGMAVAAWRSRTDPRMRAAVAIPAFILVYLVAVSLPARHYERNLLPILPYLAVAGGIATATLIGSARSQHLSGIARPRLASGLVAIGLLACLVLPASASVEMTNAMRGPDTRSLARTWMLEHVPKGATIAREAYTPQFNSREFQVRGSYFLHQHTLDEYRKLGVRYLIASGRTYDRFVDMPGAVEESAFYHELFALPEVFRVDPGPGRRGPTIRIFRLDPVSRWTRPPTDGGQTRSFGRSTKNSVNERQRPSGPNSSRYTLS